MTGELFDPTPYVVTVRDPDRYVTPGMGQDARRTARRRALIEDGVHPATRFPLTGLGSCGDCAHLILKDGPALGAGAGRWWKCTQALKDGRGPDIVRSWPSCTAWRDVLASGQSRPRAGVDEQDVRALRAGRVGLLPGTGRVRVGPRVRHRVAE